MKSKKIIIISGLSLLILVILAIVLFSNNNSEDPTTTSEVVDSSTSQPEIPESDSATDSSPPANNLDQDNDEDIPIDEISSDNNSVIPDVVDDHAHEETQQAYIVLDNPAQQLDAYHHYIRWLYFHASWCPSCKQLKDDIQANLDQIPEGLSILEVDWDSNQELRQQYKVTIQTTVLALDASGQQFAKYVGYSDSDRLSLATLIKDLDQ
ncbi:MAG: thioredoxin family protein [Candidatus Saccharibacteria bacterium]|nr:thioredoxin family protein [Candidatus Saccharibacteria bacterium]